MSELTNWLRLQAERQEGLISLQDALLSDRSDSYGWVRLRYFALRLAVASALHAVKIALLYQVFSHREFVAVLLLQTAVGLASNFWWGLLELMRKRVRDLYRSGTAHRISREVGTWLSLSIQISLVTALVSVSWILWQVVIQGQAPGAADLYALVVLLGFALSVPTRCYHSGIYALRRIYRPPVAIIVVELLSFGGVLAFWPWLGVWSLPVGGIVSTLAATGVMVHYTRRTYSVLRFDPSEFLRIRRFRLPFRGAVAEALEGGLSYAIMAMDSILVFTLFAGAGDSGGLALFAVFFAASPLIRAASDWARLFYFDLKRLEVRPFGNLRKRFERQVERLTWPVSFLLWAFAMAVATLVFQTNLGALYAFMLPFFVAQSLLAAAQVQSFSREAYGEVLKSGLLVASGFMVLGILGGNERAKVLSFSAITLAAFFMLRARQGKVEKEVESRQLLWPVEWLARIRGVARPVSVSVAEFPENGRGSQARGKLAKEDLWRRSQIADRIAARLGPRGGVTLVAPDRIVWYEEADCGRPITEGWILSLGAGLFQFIRSTGVQENGLAALNVAVREKIPGDGLAEDLDDGFHPVRFADVRGDFVSRFPDGMIYDAREPAVNFLGGLSPAERHSVWRDAIEFARGTGLYTVGSPFEVTAFCPAGELRAIFVVDRRVPRRLRSGWRRAILRFNLRASAGQVVG